MIVRTGRLIGRITQRDIFQHFVQTLSSFSSSASRAKSAQVELTFNWEWRTSALPPTDSCPEGGGWVMGQLQERCYLLSWWMKERGSVLDVVITSAEIAIWLKVKGWERWINKMLHVTGITDLHLHFCPCFPSAACNNRKHHGAIRGLLTFCRYVWNKVSVLPGLFLHRPSFLRLCDTDVSVGGLNSPLFGVNSSFSPAPGFSRLPFEVRWGMARAHMHSVPPHRRHETSESSSLTPPPKETSKPLKNHYYFILL